MRLLGRLRRRRPPRLRRVFSLSAQTSIMREGPNPDYYLTKRTEGCKHVQAVIALARRRVDVLWALLRDGRAFASIHPSPTPLKRASALRLLGHSLRAEPGR
jgi:hypothetical protein